MAITEQMSVTQKARARLMLKHPFFASLLLSMPVVERKDIPTAATDGVRLFYNTEFMESLTIEENIGVNIHEVLHKMLKHMLRRGSRNPMIWNFACDFAINPIIVDNGGALPKGCMLDPQYKGQTAEVIYEELMKKIEQERKKQKGKSQKGQDPGQSGGGGGQPDRGDDEGQTKGPYGMTVDEVAKALGAAPDAIGSDLIEPQNLDPETRAKIERQIDNAVASATNVARMAGKMSADLERLVGDILNPKIPWQALLREYMTRAAHDDESWTRRNRRITSAVLPSRYSQRMGEIIFIGDTSGSVTTEEHAMTAAEVGAVADQVRPELIRIFWADTCVKGEQTFEPGEEIKIAPRGGGGTDMRVPLAHVEQFNPEIVVLVTDGHTPWPDAEPPYPLIVVCTTDVDVPIGQVVRLK